MLLTVVLCKTLQAKMFLSISSFIDDGAQE